VEKFGGMMKTDTTYSPSNCFHTFPLPYDPEIHIHCNLEKIADELDTKRKSILYAGQVGLTDALMRIHNHEFRSKDTEELRQLRERIDNEVISAYGWSDLGLRHGFYRTKQGVRFTISEAARREVLSRLLKLNHERYEEEVRQGLHEKSAKGARKAKATKGGSGKSRASMRSTPLFDTDNKISEEDDVTD
jgi:hypothetical protein